MTNMMAVNTDDGSLYLAKILGPNNVELNKYAGGGVRYLKFPYHISLPLVVLDQICIYIYKITDALAGAQKESSLL